MAVYDPSTSVNAKLLTALGLDYRRVRGWSLNAAFNSCITLTIERYVNDDELERVVKIFETGKTVDEMKAAAPLMETTHLDAAEPFVFVPLNFPNPGPDPGMKADGQ